MKSNNFFKKWVRTISLLSYLLNHSLIANQSIITDEPYDYHLSFNAISTSEAVFRGKKQSKAAGQSHINLTKFLQFGQIYGQIWAHLPFEKHDTLSHCTDKYSKTSSEINFTGGYQMPIGLPSHGGCSATDGILSLDMGYTHYYYPDKATYYTLITPRGTFGLTHTHELFLGIKGNIIGDPQYYTYYDINRQQWVFQMNFGHQMTIESLKQFFSFCDDVILDIQLYCGYLMAHDYLGNQTRSDYNKAYPGTPFKKWKNHYAYWGLNMGLFFQITPHLGFLVATHYTGNKDGTSGFGPNRCVQPNMGDHSQFFGFDIGIQAFF